MVRREKSPVDENHWSKTPSLPPTWSTDLIGFSVSAFAPSWVYSAHRSQGDPGLKKKNKPKLDFVTPHLKFSSDTRHLVSGKNQGCHINLKKLYDPPHCCGVFSHLIYYHPHYHHHCTYLLALWTLWAWSPFRDFIAVLPIILNNLPSSICTAHSLQAFC